METNPFAPPKAAALSAADEQSTLVLEGRKVAASRGSAWFGEAWVLFKRSPGIWILMLIIYMVASFLLAIIPGGSILSTLFSPVIMAGLMLGCADLEAGVPLELSHLFAGFKRNMGNLLLVGLLYMVALVIAMMVVFFPVGVFMAIVMPNMMQSIDPNDLGAIVRTLWPILAIGVLLMLAVWMPVLAMVWFAPALVVFHDVAPMAAMKASLMGIVRNILPFLVNGLVGLGLLLLALIPLGLGLLVFLPVLWITMYTGYRDIYIRPA